MKSYPALLSEQAKDLASAYRYIQRLRDEDVRDFDNLANVYMAGRKVGKIPSGSADVDPEDRFGDFNYDADYLYLVINDSGAAWRRIPLEVW